MTRITEDPPWIFIHVHRPRPVGSLPVVETQWAISLVAMMALPSNCLGLDMGSSVRLLAMDDLKRQKCGRAHSVHWSSGGSSCQHKPVSVQQKISMSKFVMLLNRCLFFAWCDRWGNRLMFWKASRLSSGCLGERLSPKVLVSCSRMLSPSRFVWK